MNKKGKRAFFFNRAALFTLFDLLGYFRRSADNKTTDALRKPTDPQTGDEEIEPHTTRRGPISKP